MIAATEPKAARPRRYNRRFSRRDQAHRTQIQPAPLKPEAFSPELAPGQDARRRVRVEMRREVNQMLKLFTLMQAAADSLRRREEGQTMAEYGVVLAVITLAVIGAITLLSDNVRSAIESVANILP